MNDKKVLVITSFNEGLYKEYAHRFTQSYNLPFDLKIYAEDQFSIDENYAVLELDKSLHDFVERNQHKTFEDYRGDAVRFSYKVYAVTQAALAFSNSYDILVWIDADSVFYKSFDLDFIQAHLYQSHTMMTYLGRGDFYSECGFLLWNLKHPDAHDYFQEMKRMYDQDLVFLEKEQHDSYIWDVVRKKFEQVRGTKNLDIGDQQEGHVQARSILGGYYDHTKGARKQSGKSPEARI